MNIFGYVRESINEGDGLRSVLFVSGCHGQCEKCHNPESWDYNYGHKFEGHIRSKIVKEITENPLLQGVTYCGGEPFLSSVELLNLTKEIKQRAPSLDFWSYSGYTFEQIIKDPIKLELLKEIDVLIDGKFVESKKDLTLKFRGSSNQRIIDVKKSLSNNQVVLWEDRVD